MVRVIDDEQFNKYCDQYIKESGNMQKPSISDILRWCFGFIKKTKSPHKKHVGRPANREQKHGEYTADELEFVYAMEDFKQRSGNPFPSWSDALKVIKQLGYTKGQP